MPQALAYPDSEYYLKELLLVGATKNKGTQIAGFTNRDRRERLPHVYAEGEDVECPARGRTTGYYHTSGTSHGTSMMVYDLYTLGRGTERLEQS